MIARRAARITISRMTRTIRSRMIRTLSASVALCAALLLAACSAGEEQRFHSFAEVKADAAKRGVPVLLDFSARWCGPCKTFARTRLSDEHLRQVLDTKVAFLALDAESGEGAALARVYPVDGYPTFVVVRADGRYVTHFSGFGGPEEWIHRLDTALAQ